MAVLSFWIPPRAAVGMGPLIVVSGLYASSMMVLVNDRIYARHRTSSVTTLQLDVMTNMVSRQPVSEECTVGEPNGVQAAD